MSLNSIFGSFPATTTRTWKPQIKVSGDHIGYAIAGEFMVDPTLNGLASDVLDPRVHVAIPMGRFCGFGYSTGRGASAFNQTLTDRGRTVITIANGSTIRPAGMNTAPIFKQEGNMNIDGFAPVIERGCHVEVPFVLGVNGVAGTLLSGDYLAAYGGSITDSNPGVNIHRGKPVKWNARRNFIQSGSASATWTISASTNAGIAPVFVAAFATGTLLSGLTAAFAHNGTNWILTLTGGSAATTTEVHYTWGQESDQIAGEVERVRSLADLQANDRFLKWVEYNGVNGGTDLPPTNPAMRRYPVTAVTNETPTAVVANYTYRTLFPYISYYNSVRVEVRNARITLTDGTTASYTTGGGTWYTLPTANAPMVAQHHQFMGMYHNLNWRTGDLTINTNVQPISGNLEVRVSYSYITNPRDGSLLWGAGIVNLTDGGRISVNQTQTDPVTGLTTTITPATGAGLAGIPAHLNYDDGVGALRLFVKGGSI